jgi:hypothetical protein
MANISSSNKRIEVYTTPTPTLINYPLNDKSKIIKRRECSIPLPTEKQIRSKLIDYRKSEDGKPVKVSITNYASKNDFFFKQEPINPRNTYKTFRLVWIDEFKVNEKIFGYMVFAQESKPSEQSNANSSYEHKSVYRCYDFNGDGKFEYLTDDGMEVPSVPKWVLE